jgi:hypothetical protein
MENTTTRGDDLLEISKGREVPIGERLIQDRPEVLGGLQLGRVWGQGDGPEAFGHDQVGRGVPAGVVEQKRDNALASCPSLAGKQRQERGEERLGHPIRYIPEGLARDRLDEGGHIQPLVAVVTERDRSLALGRPHPAQDRLQPDAVLVGGPDLNRLVRVLGCFLGNNRDQLFLNVSRCSGVAEAGWRGRGFCTDQPIAFRASQPRWGKTAASPSSLAIQRATFGLVHRPPSGGGSRRRSLSLSSRSGLRTEGLVPFRRRRSPRACGPWAL